jgi:hypothetical protein
VSKEQKHKRTPFTDPVTGDQLTVGEEVSWVMQGIIRRWIVFILITVFTIYAWTKGHIWAQGLTDQWNLFASYWAMALETIVGIAMFSQTRRDAVFIRTIARLEQQSCEQLARLEQINLNHEETLLRLEQLVAATDEYQTQYNPDEDEHGSVDPQHAPLSPQPAPELPRSHPPQAPL